MKKSFEKSGDFAFTLTKTEVKELCAIIKKDSAQYETKIRGRLSDLSFSMDDLDEFIESEGIPDQLDYLFIEAYVYSKEEREISKSIDISSFTESNKLQLEVRGTDQTWVLGKFEEMLKFFNSIAQTKTPINHGAGGASKKVYKEEGRIWACVLTKDDLIDLISVLLTDISNQGNSARLNIKTEIANMKIEANSIQQFVEQIGSFDRLNDLTIYVHSADNIFVYLHFDAFNPSITVQGNNEIWVRGKYMQLQDFIKKNRVWYWWGQRYFGALTLVLFVASIYATIFLIEAKQITGIISAGISVISWLIAVILNFKGNLLPASYITLKQKRARISKEDIALLVALLTFILYLYELFIK